MLRVGILIESGKVPLWIAEVIREIDLIKNVQWAFAVRCPDSLPTKKNTFFKIFKKLGATLLPGKPDWTSKIDLNLLLDVTALELESISDPLSAEAFAAMAASNPDVILNFTSAIPNQEILKLPKFGNWSLAFGDEKDLNNETAGFHEWFYRHPVTKIALCNLSDVDGNCNCLVDAPVKTEYLSFSRNQSAVFSKAIDVFVNVVSRMSTSELPAATYKTEIKFEPGLWSSLIACSKLITRAILKFLNKKFFIEQWVLFYSLSPVEIPKLNFQKFKALIPPKDRIWADPFVVTENGKHYVFIEELFLKTNKGHLSCLVLNANGEVESSQIILDKPYHLSYPFLFQHQNVWYMIPESADNDSVDLFECTEFPFRWKHKQSLLKNVKAYDTTLHFHNNTFWLFCTIKKREGASTDDDLYLFYSNDFLTDDWNPHPKNPVISDPSVARPAGRIFMHRDSLYRPSQIGVPRYGYGLALNKIIELNEVDYREETVSKALPDWREDVLSVHTFNFTESITVIDGQLKRFRY